MAARIASANGTNTEFTYGDVATAVSALKSAASPSYMRCSCGPHCFFVEKLSDGIRVYQSFYHAHPLSTTVPAKGSKPDEFCTGLSLALAPKFDPSQLQNAQQVEQQKSQRALFYNCSFYTPPEEKNVGFVVDDKPASESAIISAAKKWIQQYADAWNKWLKLDATLAALFKDVSKDYGA